MQNKQDGYECHHIPTHQVITQPYYVTVIPASPMTIAMIDAIGKFDGIQNQK